MQALVKIEDTSIGNKLPTFIQSEYGFDINFTIYKDDGVTVENLTGKDVTFQIKNINKSVNKISSVCNIITALDGKCSYPVSEEDFNEIGLYEAELNIEVTATSKRIVKLGMFAIVSEIV
jgi:hypothetical protein